MNEDTPAPSENEDPRAEIWKDDVLDRRGFADFLTNALTEQTRAVSERQQRGLTVALDAGWGTGKTFFVKHWADDLKARGHPVVYFDAWENDLGEEAAIALMAAIKDTIDEWVAKMPATQLVKTRATEALRQGVKHLGRAVVPVSKVLGAAIFKKATTAALEEVVEAWNGQGSPPSGPEEGLSEEKIEAGLDKIFENALGEQKKRIEAINCFKSFISKVLALIVDNAKAQMPIYIFVDELDRCRPSYAINMLEEIKHLFGIESVCFVVSTNLEQLACSVQAIYGQGFDANGYLKRFFEQIFLLPPPANRVYAELLWEQSKILSKRKLALGLPHPSESEKKYSTPADAVSLVFDTLDVDLRSQKQVFAIADLAAASISREKKVFVFWLFFLCTLIHKKPNIFASLASKRRDPRAIISVLNEDFIKEIKIEHYLIDNFGRKKSRTETTTKTIIEKYFYWSSAELLEMADRNKDRDRFPESNIEELLLELPNPRYADQKYYPSIANYLELVKYAGYVKSTDE